jgi:hypothetical protein
MDVRKGVTGVVTPFSSAAGAVLRALLVEETAGLVVPAGRDGRKLLLVLLAVVGAEEKFAVVHDDADVSLCSAAVAAVGRRQLVVVRIELVHGTALGSDR